jgi:hypothetical protein
MPWWKKTDQRVKGTAINRRPKQDLSFKRTKWNECN